MADTRELVTRYHELTDAIVSYFDMFCRRRIEPVDSWTRLLRDVTGYRELFGEILRQLDESNASFYVVKEFDPKALAWMTDEIREMTKRVDAGAVHESYAVNFIRDIEKSHIFTEMFAAFRTDAAPLMERLNRQHQSVLGHKGMLLGIDILKPAPEPPPHKPDPAAKKAVSLLSGIRARLGEVIELPHPAYVGEATLEECLKVRRSMKEFGAGAVTLDQVSQLLFAAQGITDPRGFRTAPSAKASYPLELTVIANRVEGLTPGAYLYDSFEHQLKRTRNGELNIELAADCHNQEWVLNAPVLVVVTTYVTMMLGMTAEQSLEVGLLEAGHATQNLLLQACALSMNTAVVGEFKADAIGRLLQLKQTQRLIYVICAGPRP